MSSFDTNSGLITEIRTVHLAICYYYYYFFGSFSLKVALKWRNYKKNSIFKFIVSIFDTKRKKRIHWSSESEHCLLDIWEEKYEQLRDTRQTARIHEEIARLMAEQNYPLTVFEVKGKLHNVTNRYREERKKLVLDNVPSTWPLFERVHNILGKHKSYSFENSDYKEKSTKFAFIEAESFMEEELLVGEEDIFKETKTKQENDSETETAENKTKQKDLLAHNRELLNKRRRSLLDEDTTTQTTHDTINAAKRLKKIADTNTNTLESSCFIKLADTINDVVRFITKQETEKSRNDAFLKVLDSYLLQLPESTQEKLKIQILTTVFDKVSATDENTNENCTND